MLTTHLVEMYLSLSSTWLKCCILWWCCCPIGILWLAGLGWSFGQLGGLTAKAGHSFEGRSELWRQVGASKAGRSFESSGLVGAIECTVKCLKELTVQRNSNKNNNNKNSDNVILLEYPWYKLPSKAILRCELEQVTTVAESWLLQQWHASLGS